MSNISLTSFIDELEKISSAGHALVDLAGLGMLAAPSVQGLRGKEMSEKSKHKFELAGLGTLAAGVAHENRPSFLRNIGKKAVGAAATVAKHASIEDLAENYLEKISKMSRGRSSDR